MKARYEIVPATAAHARELAVTMRQADVEELAELGREPLEALELSLAGTPEPFAGLVNGRVACIFGVYPGVGEAFPWLLASDEMVRHAFTFLKLNRPYIAKIKREFGLLHNFVNSRNVAAIRWLGWLGFSVASVPQPVGPKGAMMLHFEARSHV